MEDLGTDEEKGWKGERWKGTDRCEKMCLSISLEEKMIDLNWMDLEVEEVKWDYPATREGVRGGPLQPFYWSIDCDSIAPWKHSNCFIRNNRISISSDGNQRQSSRKPILLSRLNPSWECLQSTPLSSLESASYTNGLSTKNPVSMLVKAPIAKERAFDVAREPLEFHFLLNFAIFPLTCVPNSPSSSFPTLRSFFATHFQTSSDSSSVTPACRSSCFALSAWIS